MITENIDIKVIESSEGRVQMELIFSPDYVAFGGHFDGFPLLPGVVQTHLAVRLAEKFLGREMQFQGIKNIKFFKPIFPKMRVMLDCEWPVGQALTFRYFNGETTFSKGVIVGGNA